jgi:hypothetical protein
VPEVWTGCNQPPTNSSSRASPTGNGRSRAAASQPNRPTRIDRQPGHQSPSARPATGPNPVPCSWQTSGPITLAGNKGGSEAQIGVSGDDIGWAVVDSGGPQAHCRRRDRIKSLDAPDDQDIPIGRDLHGNGGGNNSLTGGRYANRRESALMGLWSAADTGISFPPRRLRIADVVREYGGLHFAATAIESELNIGSTCPAA